MTDNELMIIAQRAAEAAYAPYSDFKVGAALLCSDGRVYTGCNVENSSYGGAICAERTAAVKAVSEGSTKFTALAITGLSTKGMLTPCGICRQFLSEFAADDMRIIMKEGSGTKSVLLSQMFPAAFGKSQME